MPKIAAYGYPFARVAPINRLTPTSATEPGALKVGVEFSDPGVVDELARLRRAESVQGVVDPESPSKLFKVSRSFRKIGK